MTIHPRIKALFLLVLASIIIGGVVFWMYFGDRGTLILEGDIPDIITGIRLGDQKCEKTPCAFTILSGDYDVTFEKEGYYPLTKNIRIYLFEETKIQLTFTKKPFLQNIGTVEYYSPPLSSIEEKYKDNQDSLLLPFLIGKTNTNTHTLQSIKEISFSPTREKALIVTKEKVYLSNKEKIEPIEISQKMSDFIWQGDTVYFWDKEQGENIWELKMLNTESKKASRVALFYNLINPSILPGNGKIVILQPFGAYMVDLQTYKKQEVLDSFHIANGLWNESGTQFLFQTKEKGLFLLNIENNEVQEITNIVSTDNLNYIRFYEEGILYLEQETSKQNLVVYDLIKKDKRLIFSFSLEEDKKIKKIEVYHDRIYLLVDQEVYVVEGEIRS